MENDIAIKIENLYKQYMIGGNSSKYRTFRETITTAISSPFIKVKHLIDGIHTGAAGLTEKFWALQDVSFKVKKGDIVGIIGRNGAGKSTLLKVLSRITEPTTGTVDIYGRVGSLLEVGTGFHPELTGMENIYLNGAILGMSRFEINEKVDEIIAFAEMEKFINTPVKHYSSGMYLRLAFAVAAHLEPEILLVDEVLAVGDANFQKKCLGKMGDVAKEGRTVMLVSHNMAAIQNLCSISYWIDQGVIKGSGETSSVIESYLSEGKATEERSLESHSGRISKGPTIMKKIRLLKNGMPSSTFENNGKFGFEVYCDADRNLLETLSLGFSIKDRFGRIVYATNMTQWGKNIRNEKQRYIITITVDSLTLSPGIYSLFLYLGNGSYDIDMIENAIHFDVILPTGNKLVFPPKPDWGPVILPVDWSIRGVNELKIYASDN